MKNNFSTHLGCKGPDCSDHREEVTNELLPDRRYWLPQMTVELGHLHESNVYFAKGKELTEVYE